MIAAWFFWPESEHKQSSVMVDSSLPLAPQKSQIALPRHDLGRVQATINSTIAQSSGIPIVTAPPDIVVEASGELTVIELGKASVSDDKDAALQAIPDQSGPFAIGNHTVHWRATDSDGLTGEAVQRVIVQRPLSKRWFRHSLPDKIIVGEQIALQWQGAGEFDRFQRNLHRDEVRWKLDQSGVINIANADQLVAMRPGVATISASFSGIERTFKVAVVAGSFHALHLGNGEPETVYLYQFYYPQGSVTLSDGSTVTLGKGIQWQLSNPSLMSMEQTDNGQVRFKAIAPGEVVINAFWQGLSASQRVIIPADKVKSLALKLNNIMLLGMQQYLSVEISYEQITFTNSSDGVHFSSSNHEVIELIEGHGEPQLLAKRAGKSEISATFAGITVSQTIQVMPQLERVFIYPYMVNPKGIVMYFHAFGVPPDSPLRQVLEAMKNDDFDNTTVFARYGLTASEFYEQVVDLREMVQLHSSSPDVLAVSDKWQMPLPVAIMVGSGTATITASLGSLHDSTTVQVNRDPGTFWLEVLHAVVDEQGRYLLHPHQESLTTLLRAKDKVTGDLITIHPRVTSCHSSNPSVVEVSGRYSLHPLGAGEATIHCELDGTAIQASRQMVVAAADSLPVSLRIEGVASFAAFQPQSLKVTGNFASGAEIDVTDGCSFRVSDPSVVRIQKHSRRPSPSKQRIYGLRMGQASVTAQCGNIISPPYQIRVINDLSAITLEPSLKSMMQGLRQILNYQLHFSDGSTAHDDGRLVTWKSTTPTLLRIEGGSLVALAAGRATLVATIDHFRYQQQVTIHSGSLLNLQLTPSKLDLTVGQMVLFPQVEGVLDDGSRISLNAYNCDAHSTPSGLTLDKELLYSSQSYSGLYGIMARQSGQYQIEVSCDGLSQWLPVSVSNTRLISGRAIIQPKVIHQGDDVTLGAVGLFDDAIERRVDYNTKWTSSDRSIISETMRWQAHQPGRATISGVIKLNGTETRIASEVTVLPRR